MPCGLSTPTTNGSTWRQVPQQAIGELRFEMHLSTRLVQPFAFWNDRCIQQNATVGSRCGYCAEVSNSAHTDGQATLREGRQWLETWLSWMFSMVEDLGTGIMNTTINNQRCVIGALIKVDVNSGAFREFRLGAGPASYWHQCFSNQGVCVFESAWVVSVFRVREFVRFVF